MKLSYTLEYGSAAAEMQKDAFPLALRPAATPATTTTDASTAPAASSTTATDASATEPRRARGVICDDLLATGGTLVAGMAVAREVGIDVIAAMVMIELEALNGAARLGVPCYTVWKY